MKAIKFKQFLDKVNKVSKKNSILPICEYILIKESFLIWSDLEIEIRQHIADLAYMPTCLLPIKEMIKLVDKLKDNDIYFEYNHETLILEIKTSKGNFKYKVMSYKEYPKIIICDSSLDKQLPSTLSKDDVLLIRKAFQYVGDDGLRPALRNVFIDIDYIVGTDATVMGYYKRGQSLTTESFIMIPEIVKLLDDVHYDIYCDRSYIEVERFKLDDNGNILVEESENGNNAVKHIAKEEVIKHINLYDAYNKLSYTFRIVDGVYPKWRNVVPQAFKYIFIMDSKELKEILEMSELAINKNTNKIELKLNIEDRTITFHTKDLHYDREYTNVSKNITCQSKHIGTIDHDDIIIDDIRRTKLHDEDWEYVFKEAEVLNEGVAQTKQINEDGTSLLLNYCWKKCPIDNEITIKVNEKLLKNILKVENDKTYTFKIYKSHRGININEKILLMPIM